MLPLGESKKMQVNYQFLLIFFLVSLLDLNFNIPFPILFPLISTHKSHQLVIPHLPNIPQRTWALVNSKPFCWKPKAVCRCAGDNVDGRSAGPNNFAFCAKAASNSWWHQKEMIHRYCTVDGSELPLTTWDVQNLENNGINYPDKDPSDSNSNPRISVQYNPQQIPETTRVFFHCSILVCFVGFWWIPISIGFWWILKKNHDGGVFDKK